MLPLSHMNLATTHADHRLARQLLHLWMHETCILQQTRKQKDKGVRQLDVDKHAMMPKPPLANWAAGLKGGNGGGGRKEGQGEMVAPLSKRGLAAACTASVLISINHVYCQQHAR